jgi:hypothetical protein
MDEDERRIVPRVGIRVQSQRKAALDNETREALEARLEKRWRLGVKLRTRIPKFLRRFLP